MLFVAISLYIHIYIYISLSLSLSEVLPLPTLMSPKLIRYIAARVHCRVCVTFALSDVDASLKYEKHRCVDQAGLLVTLGYQPYRVASSSLAAAYACMHTPAGNTLLMTQRRTCLFKRLQQSCSQGFGQISWPAVLAALRQQQWLLARREVSGSRLMQQNNLPQIDIVH